jgi:hypothetical protein
MQIDGSITVPGNINLGGTLNPTQSRLAILAKETLVKYPIPFYAWRQTGAVQTNLSNTSSGSDLAVAGGTFNTNAPYLTTGNVHSSSIARKARTTWSLPPEFPAQETAAIQVCGGMQTNVADTSAVVQVDAYKSNRDTTITGSSLVTTSPQSINSLSVLPIAFALNTTTLNPGDEIDIQITVTVVDSATAGNVIANLAAICGLLSIRG